MDGSCARWRRSKPATGWTSASVTARSRLKYYPQRIRTIMTELSAEQRQILVEAIKDFNDTLQTQSINLSGQAFNNAFRLGCGILLIPLAVVLIVTQVVKGLDVSGVFV